jgi:hypothetical protein
LDAAFAEVSLPESRERLDLEGRSALGDSDERDISNVPTAPLRGGGDPRTDRGQPLRRPLDSDRRAL